MHQSEVFEKEYWSYLWNFADQNPDKEVLDDYELRKLAGYKIHSKKDFEDQWECISQPSESDNYPALLANYLLTNKFEDGQKLLEALKEGAVNYLRDGILKDSKQMVLFSYACGY